MKLIRFRIGRLMEKKKLYEAVKGITIKEAISNYLLSDTDYYDIEDYYVMDKDMAALMNVNRRVTDSTTYLLIAKIKPCRMREVK